MYHLRKRFKFDPVTSLPLASCEVGLPLPVSVLLSVLWLLFWNGTKSNSSDTCIPWTEDFHPYPCQHQRSHNHQTRPFCQFGHNSAVRCPDVCKVLFSAIVDYCFLFSQRNTHVHPLAGSHAPPVFVYFPVGI